MVLARLSPLLLITALSGCLIIPIPIPAPPGAPGSITLVEADPCGARSVSGYMGVTEAQVRETNFSAPGPVRVLVPGDSRGAEVIDNRLNFTIGADGRVVDIDCG